MRIKLTNENILFELNNGRMHHRPPVFGTEVNELLINYFRQKGKWYNNEALEYYYR